jgi:hypothetical protein
MKLFELLYNLCRMSDLRMSDLLLPNDHSNALGESDQTVCRRDEQFESFPAKHRRL